VCGLEVSATGDGEVVVGPGIAFDPYGREIVLTTVHALADPFRPTDDGQPCRPVAGGGPVTLSLRYAEQKRPGGPVVPGGVGNGGGEGPSDRTFETCRIVVRKGAPRLGPGLVLRLADRLSAIERPAGTTAAARARR
jgi:hypothetical protein